MPDTSIAANNSDTIIESNPVEEWHQKWGEFKENIRDPHRAFDQIYWIRTLSFALLNYVLYAIRSLKLVRTIKSSSWWRPILPFLAFSAITFCVACYFLFFHRGIIIPRWCPCYENVSHEDDVVCRKEFDKFCVWQYVHGIFVCYVATMIYWNYFRATFLSPGFVIPSSPFSDENESETINAVHFQEELLSLSSKSRCCYIRPTLNIENEKHRLSLYISSRQVISVSDGVRFFPSPDWTYCKKCKIKRPPRSHHCSVSNLCVLQMDHFCPWLNNCIGYYNYHSFLLALTYLVLGCGYGTAILTPPLWEIMSIQFRTHGFKVFYENKTGILNLPFPSAMWHQYKTTGAVDLDVVIKLVFLLLSFVFIVLTAFLWTHLCYIKLGMTTIERTTELDMLYNRALDTAEGLINESETQPDISNVVNPFNRGLKKNLIQVFGRDWFRLLLPLPVELPPPYVVLPRTKDE